MKNTVIISLAAAALGFLAGSQNPKGTISGPVSITTFKINVPFENWAEGFDSKDAKELHQASNIKPLFRGVKIDDERQVVVIHRSYPGAVEKLLSENKEMIASKGHIIKTTKTSNWSFNKLIK